MMIRQIKILLIFLHNIIYAVIPFFVLKNKYLRSVGVKFGYGSVIHSPVKFYSVAKLSIGDFTVINGGCSIDNRVGIIIGSNVSIARDVRILTLGHDLNCPLFSTSGKSVIIEDYVVIFTGAMIMPGVTLGRGCAVYPGAVVTKSVNPYEIVGGVPAKVMGHRSRDLRYTLKYDYWFAT